jgi:hypothetical protein
MSDRSWKTKGRRDPAKSNITTASVSMSGTRQQGLKSISEGSHEQSNRSGGDHSNKSVTSESLDDVFKMLENEERSTRTESPINPNGQADIATDAHSDGSLAREIAAELGNQIPSTGGYHNSASSAEEKLQSMPGSGDEEDGPVIYANHDDDDDYSQITSSIAGNTIYSHEYMFSSISFPQNKVTPNMNTRPGARGMASGLPSLDGTDSGGSGGSGVSQLPPMDEKKSLVMDDDDFERFFGSSSQGASQRKTATKSSECDEEINVYNGNGRGNPHTHIHSVSNFSSHPSVIDDQNDDEMTIGDIYSYAPSTVGGESKRQKINSSSPLIWIFNQAYNIFNAARYRARRKKNDDLDDNSLDEDTDYFAKLMSTDFNTSSNFNNYQWSRGFKQKKYLQTCFLIIGVLCMGSLVYSGDTGGNVDESLLGVGKPEFKTVLKVPNVVKAGTMRASKIRIDTSHEGMLLPPIFDNFAEVTDVSSSTIAFFWHVPRAAGATINDILSICHRLHVATNIGIQRGHQDDAKLSLIDFEGQQYLNVDISTSQGIERAVQMGFASTNLVDVAISSLLHDSAPLFSPSKKGKIFTMFRHPVDRMVSMFYFMQDNVWKAERTYNKELAEITIENFFLKNMGENNWHVRFLTNQLTKPYVDDNDFKLAKEVLRRKVLVGLVSEKDTSFDRFSRQLGWVAKDGKAMECQKRRLQWDWSLRHPHEVEVLEGNRLWSLISGQNQYDMKLYEYAQYLFEEQQQMFQ